MSDTTLEDSRQTFEKYSNNKFCENPSIGSRIVPCGHTNGLTDWCDENKSLARQHMWKYKRKVTWEIFVQI